MTLPIRDFPGSGDSAPLLTPLPADSRPFEEGLARGELLLQRCGACSRFRFPLAPACPHCFSDTYSWSPSTGAGVVHSWVRYHRSYLAAFEALLPYVVLTVQLDDGPRIYGRLADRGLEPRIGLRVAMIVERWRDGGHVPAFVAESPQ